MKQLSAFVVPYAVSFFLFSSPLLAQSSTFVGLRNTLLPLRAQAYARPDTRGATPALASAKSQLRDIIENRLGRLTPTGDEVAFTEQLNSEIKNADLLCSDSSEGCNPPPDRGFSGIGFVGEVEVQFQSNRTLVVVQTAFGIECGYDESAYLYEWEQDRWERRWQTEQNDYSSKGYLPQTIHKVLVSEAAPTTDERLVLTLGSNPWCTSNWQGAYYRLWRIGKTAPRLLLNKAEVAFLDNDPPVNGRVVSPTNAYVEFRTHSIDVEVHNREAVRHFVVDGSRIVRADPIALSPRSFVDEWLNHNWQESSAWSDRNNSSLLTWHRRLHNNHISGQFISPTQQCGRNSNLWQVSVRLDAPTTAPTDTHFIVRWEPTDRFRMVRISDQSSSECTNQRSDVDESKTLLRN